MSGGPKCPLSPLQELEVGGRRPPYLLVHSILNAACKFYLVEIVFPIFSLLMFQIVRTPPNLVPNIVPGTVYNSVSGCVVFITISGVVIITVLGFLPLRGGSTCNVIDRSGTQVMLPRYTFSTN